MTACKCAEYGQPWQEEDELIDVCALYVGLEGDDEICTVCAHVAACHEQSQEDDTAGIIQRLQEMEYAVSAGNLAREDVPADTLTGWFRYVRTGEVAE